MNRYHAPPVSYPVGRSVWEARCLWLLWCVSAALAAVGIHQGADLGVDAAARLSLWLVLLCWGLAAVVLWRHLAARPSGRLQWQGGQWCWCPEKDSAPPGEPMAVERLETACDFQRRLLLRLHGSAGVPRWLWLEQNLAPPRWPDLRRAVWAARSG